MTEIIFVVEEEGDGGFVASAISQSIVTQADNLEELRKNVREAVACHFTDSATPPRIIRLHFVRDEVIAA